MAAIVPETVYTKTAKGILEARNKSAKLPRELTAVFQAIDGRATVGEIQPRLGLSMPQVHQTLNTLVTDGYIKAVKAAAQPAPAAPAADAVDFAGGQRLSHLNLEAATHALAEVEANKQAQQRARTVLDARLRVEAEARARALAEVRVQAEAEARAKAEAAARAAQQARAEAERDAAGETDPAARASAEARARTAAGAAVRAEAEARARREAEARAWALVEEKKAAEARAREEVLAHEKDQEEALARAAGEVRARQLIEAKIQAMAKPHAAGNPGVSSNVEAAQGSDAQPDAGAQFQSPTGQPRGTPRAAEDGATATQGWTAEPDFSDLAQKLTARVTAERRARDDAERKHRDGVDTPSSAAEQSSASPEDFPALQFTTSDSGVASAAPPRSSPERPPLPAPDLPSLSLSSTAGAGDIKHITPDHVPSALERAMMQTAAPAEAAEEPPEEKKQSPAEASAAKTAPHIVTLKHDPSAAGDRPEPTLEGEPLNERLNVDRTAHDILAQTAEARRRAEAAELARAAAAARRQRTEEDTRREMRATRASNRSNVGRAVAIALIGVPALGIAFLQFVPLNSYIPEAQQALSQRLNQPTTISNLHYVLLPSPRLILEGVRIGSAQDVRIDRIDAHAWPTTMMADPKVFDRVDATGVTIDQGMLAAIPSWTGGRSATSVHVSRLKLTDVKLSIPESGLEGLAGDVTFEPNGTIKQAALANEKLKIELTPQQSGLRVVLNAQDWRAPFGPPAPFTFLSIDGVADKQHFGTTAFSGRVGGGAFTGTLAARWDGPLIVGGEFKVQGAKLDELMPQAAPDVKMRGTLVATGRYALQSDSASGVLGKPLVDASFSITRGELSSIDLVRAIQTGNLRGGGRTAFEELTGTVQVNGKRYSYQQLQLSSGPLNARGNVEVVAGGPINGRIDAAFDARGSSARSSFRVSGTVKEPQIVR